MQQRFLKLGTKEPGPSGNDLEEKKKLFQQQCSDGPGFPGFAQF